MNLKSLIKKLCRYLKCNFKEFSTGSFIDSFEIILPSKSRINRFCRILFHYENGLNMQAGQEPLLTDEIHI